MRFCHPFTLITNPRDGAKALARPEHTGAKSHVQCDPPHFAVSSARAIFLQPIFLRKIACPTGCPRNLTEFPFARNFSKPDLEVL
jgi:hypothetical protein